MARRVFYSFHYKPDCVRAGRVRNMGVVEGNQLATDNDWEKIKNGGAPVIHKWIDEQLYGKSCAIVLIGEKTAGRPCINYEIKTAWNMGKGVVGVYIHRLEDFDGKRANKGENPFDKLTMSNDSKLSSLVKAYAQCPSFTQSTYNYVHRNLTKWIEEAITIRKNNQVLTVK